MLFTGVHVMCCCVGGVIEDVPRGTTAGEILREKGVLAILEDDESSTDSDAEPTDLAARSSSSSSSSSSRQQQLQQRSSYSAPGSAGKLQLTRGAEAAADAGSMQQQVRLVNVNNRLVSEDTVLSDGDLVILARERIKI
jgi:molybdopterin converting factor small subunit